jgi:hypothetical protein
MVTKYVASAFVAIIIPRSSKTNDSTTDPHTTIFSSLLFLSQEGTIFSFSNIISANLMCNNNKNSISNLLPS